MALVRTGEGGDSVLAPSFCHQPPGADEDAHGEFIILSAITAT